MRKTLLLSVLLLSCFNASRAQENPCSNPKAPRIGVFATRGKANPSDTELNKRTRFFEEKLRQNVIEQLGPAICIVGDIDVFSDPANYPGLKGSMIIEITAAPSFSSTAVAAIAVNMYAAEGAYAEQRFPIGVLPVLIERDSDYEIAAKSVILYWTSITDSISSAAHKAK